MVFNVSQSKVNTRRQCGEKYRNRYILKLYKKKKARPLVFGGLIHDMLEAHANGDTIGSVIDNLDIMKKKLFASERETYGEILDDAEAIMTDYIDHWPKKSLRPVRKKKRSAEHHFNIEIGDGVFWNGKIDEIDKDPEGLIWLTEHKTFTRMPNDDDRWRNIQYSTYVQACEILGWQRPDGVAWNYIRSAPPAIPGELADGSLSQRKINTLPSVVERTIDSYEFDKKDYSKLLSMAKANRPNYFKRVFMAISTDVVSYLFDEFKETAINLSVEHESVKGMNIGRHCGWCDYEMLCRAKLTGADVDYLIEKEYTDESTKPSKEGIFIHEGSIK